MDGSRVVRIVTTVRERCYARPWEPQPALSSGGLGVIIAPGRILTCAHVVWNAEELRVACTSSDGTQHSKTASVIAVSHDTELALLEADTEGTDILALTSETVPRAGVRVTALVFDDSGSVTPMSGDVLGTPVRTYAHSQRELMLVETSLLLPEGCSGAPVFTGGGLVGIAFQTLERHGVRVTDLVPSILIERFLKCVANGNSADVPDLGVFWQKMNNDCLRDYFQVSEPGGILISEIVEGSSACGRLMVGDIITSIDGSLIASDASISMSGGNAHFSHLISQRVVGDCVTIGVRRRGLDVDVEVELLGYAALVPPPRPERPPRYAIIGGVVLLPLTYEYLAERGLHKAHFRLKSWYYDGSKTSEVQEMVIVSEVIPHSVNVGYQAISGVSVVCINGVALRSFEDVVLALGNPLNGYHVLIISNRGLRRESDADYGNVVVLRATHAADADAKILADSTASALIGSKA